MSLPDIVIIIYQQKKFTTIQECITLGNPTTQYDKPMDGIVGRSISRMGKGSLKDITCASCFVFTSTTSKLEGGKRRGENGKGP